MNTTFETLLTHALIEEIVMFLGAVLAMFNFNLTEIPPELWDAVQLLDGGSVHDIGPEKRQIMIRGILSACPILDEKYGPEYTVNQYARMILGVPPT